MLINTKTLERVSEQQFRMAHPSTSFPAILTNALLRGFGLACLEYPQVPVPSAGRKIVDGGAEQIGGVWRVKYVEAPLSAADLEHIRQAELAYAAYVPNEEPPADEDVP